VGEELVKDRLVLSEHAAISKSFTAGVAAPFLIRKEFALYNGISACSAMAMIFVRYLLRF
jgi:hypothetical protein